MNTLNVKIQMLLILFMGAYSQPCATEALYIISNKKEVHVQAIAHPDQFQGLDNQKNPMSGYHLLVWNQGRAASNALFTTTVSDSALHNALIQIGAKPSNELNLDTWDQRNDPKHPAPDQHVTGTPIDIDIQWPNQEAPQPLSDMITDTGGRGFDFRFGGHLANQSQWHSGCGVCLYSCPGGKISNAAYTVRDYVQKNTQFRIRPNVSLKNDTPVTLIFHIKETPHPMPTKEN
jgi:hypothetical protein